MNHLQLILDGKFPAVFPEFLHHLLENNKRLPTSQLPALMARPDIDEWWDLIEPTLGSGGKWLLSQHPEWRFRLGPPSELQWDSATKDQKLQLLQSWRIHEPATAISQLQTTWEQEHHRNKKAYLKTLETGLSSEDEPFLEQALNDSRKEVRQEAVVLLAKLPLSDYAERMFQRALACLFYQKGRWHFDLPEEPDDAARQDGILQLDVSRKGGKKAGYLAQVFSKIPPSRWELHFEAEPVEVLSLFQRTDWGSTILAALAEAAVFHQDEKWVGALVSYWFERADSFLWNEPLGGQLLEMAPPETVNALCLQVLQDQKGLPDEDTPVFQLLLANDAPWDNDLTKLIISRLQEWLAVTKVMDWETLHYKQFLDMIAVRSNPMLFIHLEKGWRVTAPLWYNWESLVSEALHVLMFRREMILELGS